MIVVIGAGPAGLACAAVLQGAGERVVVVERGGVGAAWMGRYDRLQLHTVRWLSCLPGYRMPRSFGKWPSRERVLEYLQRYAERHALEVRTGVEVERVDRGGAGWVIKTASGELEAERVVVATGYSNVPFVPDWPGVFAGAMVHSADYRNPASYVGRRVLVVGAGNSGAEIAVDLVGGGAAAVLLSVRTPPSIVRRDTLGVPSQLLGIATGHLPVPMVDRIARTLRRVSFPDLAPYGLPAPKRPYSDFLRRRALPILDIGLVEEVRAGSCACGRGAGAVRRRQRRARRWQLGRDRRRDRSDGLSHRPGAARRSPRSPHRLRRATSSRRTGASQSGRPSLCRLSSHSRRHVQACRHPGETTRASRHSKQYVL